MRPAAAVAHELATTPRELPDLAEACRAAWAEYRYTVTHAAFTGLLGLGLKIGGTSAPSTIDALALSDLSAKALAMAGGHKHGARAAGAICDLLSRAAHAEATGQPLAAGPSLRDIDRAFANHALFVCAYLMKRGLLTIEAGQDGRPDGTPQPDQGS